MEWPNGIYYRLLFLGPLPHVLVCLSAAHSWAIDTKARNKKRLKVASHQELEDVGKRLTEHKYGLVLMPSGRHSQHLFRKIIKDLQRLQEALKPQSELHRKREVETLKSLVMEVESFLANIAHTVAREVKDDMAMAIKGIVAIRKPPKPKQKPAIKIDDSVGDLHGESKYSTEKGNDINSEVDVKTIAEGMRIGYCAEDDVKKKDGVEDDFSQWMKMKKMLAM